MASPAFSNNPSYATTPSWVQDNASPTEIEMDEEMKIDALTSLALAKALLHNETLTQEGWALATTPGTGSFAQVLAVRELLQHMAPFPEREFSFLHPRQAPSPTPSPQTSVSSLVMRECEIWFPGGVKGVSGRRARERESGVEVVRRAMKGVKRAAGSVLHFAAKRRKVESDL